MKLCVYEWDGGGDEGRVGGWILCKQVYVCVCV